jgi:anti-sigma-K factor RskA
LRKRSMGTAAHVEDMLPALALGCLEPQERARVSRHLESCAACRSQLAGYEELVGSLSLAAPQARPPRRLRTRILQQTSRGSSRERSWPMPRLAWPLAAAALLALSLGLNLLLWQRVTRMEAVSAVLPGQIAVLAATEAAAGARGLLLFRSEENQATLVVEDLPPLESGRQYQLWLLREGQRTSGGVFSVTERGYACQLILSPLPFTDYQALGITVEPAGGSPGPTGQRVLGGSL